MWPMGLLIKIDLVLNLHSPVGFLVRIGFSTYCLPEKVTKLGRSIQMRLASVHRECYTPMVWVHSNLRSMKYLYFLQTLSDEDSFKSCCSVKEVHQKLRDLIKSLMIRFVLTVRLYFLVIKDVTSSS